MDLFKELIAVIAVLKKFKYLLIGGLAYSIYSQPRFTEDIDFMLAQDDFDKVRKALTKHGFLDIENIMRLGKVKIARCVKVKHSDTLIIDFLLKPHKEFNKFYKNKNVISRGRVKINVIAIKDLIRIKSQRNSPQDKVDIKNLKSV